MNRDSGSSAVEVTLRSWVEPTARMRGSEAGGLTAAEQDLKGIRAPDAAGLRHLLSAFGGMGSLADLTSDRRNATRWWAWATASPTTNSHNFELLYSSLLKRSKTLGSRIHRDQSRA